MQEKFIFNPEPLKVIGWLNSSLLKLVAKPIPDHISVNKRRKDKNLNQPDFYTTSWIMPFILIHNTYIILIVTTKLVFLQHSVLKWNWKVCLSSRFFYKIIHLLFSLSSFLYIFSFKNISFIVLYFLSWPLFLFSFSLHRFLLLFCWCACVAYLSKS